MDTHEKDHCAQYFDADRKARIRELNDQFRCSQKGGYVCITGGVTALGRDTQTEVLQVVAAFSEFTPENDPHDEHDFGAFSIGALRLFWKIDYYDHTQTQASPDPGDPRLTTRILTILLASEY